LVGYRTNLVYLPGLAEAAKETDPEKKKALVNKNVIPIGGPAPQKGFTLSPGQTRFSPDGKPIANVPESSSKGNDDFRQWTSQLDSLVKSKASILKGIDPFTQQIIPQDQIQEAAQMIQSQIDRLQQYLDSQYGDQWRTYTGPDTPSMSDMMEKKAIERGWTGSPGQSAGVPADSVQDIIAAGGKVMRDPKTGDEFVFDRDGNLIGQISR